MMFKRLTGAVAAALVFCVSSAQAIDYRVDFTVGGFEYFQPGVENDAPFSSAHGFALFSAPSLRNDWTTLSEFNLVVGDHIYTLADVGYDSFGFGASVGGLLNGTHTMHGRTNDFWLDIYYDSVDLRYSTVAKNGFWISTISTQQLTQLTATPVPEAGTYAMLLAGLGLLGVAARRRKA